MLPSAGDQNIRTSFREYFNPLIASNIPNGSFSTASADMQFPGAMSGYQVNPAAAAAAAAAAAGGGLGGGLYSHYPATQQQQQQQQHLQHLQVTANSLAHMSQGQQFQRLKVEDALSYLDQVKLQFGNQPQVYNDFLDIMKEFKSQTIDTPGVIKRVSNLFHGHPDLVVGFNTFLPPGYKIEVQANDTISFHQPGQPAVALAPVNISARHLPTMPPSSVPPSVVNANSAASAHHSYHQTARLPPDQPLAPHAHSHGAGPPQPNQPVEFNHAINYVNKIKNRFQGQPEIYKAFLEILHTYQKEQKNLKEQSLLPVGHKPLTESQVYDQVAKLFQNQEDLLSEFGQFLPDANSSTNYPVMGGISAESMLGGVRNDHSSTVKKPMGFGAQKMASSVGASKPGHLRRQPPVAAVQPPAKKQKPAALKDVSVTEAGKYGTLNEFAFFDKVRKVLKSQESYEDFLRCLSLFNQEILARTELVQMVQPFLSKYPDLYKSFKDIVGHKETASANDNGVVPIMNKERITGDMAMQIDFSSCKRYGASYRGLPKSYPLPKCSGRSQLCREVLNDTLVSIPSWSEDSNFVTAKKTHYEELIYRCEDERYQLDIIIENNADAIRVLEAVQRRLARMTADEATKFQLDDTLGGTSEVLHRKAVQRIYGDRAADIIDGLKKSPAVAVPLVLRRLKAKDEEWREAQSGFNRVWREQNEKYYLKSLDHQGINFKQTDAKLIRSKALLNEIETLFDERQEQDNAASDQPKPHLTYTYADRSLFADAWSLILHHMRRQSGIGKVDKFKMKQLIQQLIPALFFQPTTDISDDEPDNDDDDDDSEAEGDVKKETPAKKEAAATENSDGVVPQIDKKKEPTSTGFHMEPLVSASDEDGSENGGSGEGDDAYRLFFANNNWYLLFRLHDILYERLHKIAQQARRLVDEEIACRKERKESTAIALRLKLPNAVEPEGYYACFVDMAKNVLDGNLESYLYEDNMRDMFGIHAYIAFTIDKIVQNIVRQIQHIASDETSVSITAALLQEWRGGGAGGRTSTVNQRQSQEAAYQKKVEQMLSDENCFRITFNKASGQLAVELLNTDSGKSEDAFDGEGWAEARDKDEVGDKEQLPLRPVFLARNIRSRRRQQQQAVRQTKDADTTGGDADKKDDKSAVAAALGDGAECKFDVNSFKMVYVVNNENYLYKRMALARAHSSFSRVSRAKHAKFSRIVDKWCAENVGAELATECSDWLLGRRGDLVPCVTTLQQMTDTSVPPHYAYNKYRVEMTPTVEDMDTGEQAQLASDSAGITGDQHVEMEQQ